MDDPCDCQRLLGHKEQSLSPLAGRFVAVSDRRCRRYSAGQRFSRACGFRRQLWNLIGLAEDFTTRHYKVPTVRPHMFPFVCDLGGWKRRHRRHSAAGGPRIPITISGIFSSASCASHYAPYTINYPPIGSHSQSDRPHNYVAWPAGLLRQPQSTGCHSQRPSILKWRKLVSHQMITLLPGERTPT